jgi:hypothetical protein
MGACWPTRVASRARTRRRSVLCIASAWRRRSHPRGDGVQGVLRAPLGGEALRQGWRCTCVDTIVA